MLKKINIDNEISVYSMFAYIPHQYFKMLMENIYINVEYVEISLSILVLYYFCIFSWNVIFDDMLEKNQRLH